MKKIKTEEAIGHVLCHDITQIIKGVSKGPVFRKGHIIREEDIPVLLSVGKEHVYIWECDDSTLHENDAAAILRDISLGVNMHATEAKEGKIELVADCDGLLTIRRQGVQAVNSLGEMMIASRHGGFAVKRGDVLAGMRVIPLVISKAKMEAAKEAAGTEPLFNVLPFTAKTAGVVTTGSEVFKGRIADTFTPVIEDKLAEYGIAVTQHVTLADDPAAITAAIQDMLAQGVDMVFCTGGMSVDPDDNTPGGIKAAGANIIAYGAPVLPGAMFLLGYFDDGMPVMGLPGCVMYAGATVFDLVLPKIAADVPVTRADLAALGEGGLCLGCKPCHYPICPFGK